MKLLLYLFTIKNENIFFYRFFLNFIIFIIFIYKLRNIFIKLINIYSNLKLGSRCLYNPLQMFRYLYLFSSFQLSN